MAGNFKWFKVITFRCRLYYIYISSKQPGFWIDTNLMQLLGNLIKDEAINREHLGPEKFLSWHQSEDHLICTTFLERCRKVVLEIWFEKSG